jgi:hypothetical protein
MLAVQPRLPLGMPFRPRTRNVRRPFTPSFNDGPYRLPHDVRDRLAASLAPFRNRDAAFALAIFLARFWSVPGRVVGSFPIDRRELADRPDLALTEAQVRGAIRTLESVGYLERDVPPKGNGYQRTGGGELHRKAVLFAFGSEYATAFTKANERAAAVRDRQSNDRRSIPPEVMRRPSTALPVASVLNSPRVKTSEADRVIMGEIKNPPPPTEPNPALEAALARLEEGFRRSRGE